MLTEHNARLEFDRDTDEDFGNELFDALRAYHPAVGQSSLGRVQATVTFLAHDIGHAADMAVAIAGEVPDASLAALEVMTTEDFNRR